jgi:hypothetical protein
MIILFLYLYQTSSAVLMDYFGKMPQWRSLNEIAMVSISHRSPTYNFVQQSKNGRGKNTYDVESMVSTLIVLCCTLDILY